MPSRWLLPLLLALAVLIAIPASAADQSVTATSGIQFSPGDVTIDMADTVTWNNGGGTHNVVFDDGSFTEPPVPDSSSWTVDRTFDQPGIFRYQCGLHGSSMRGVVRVRDATGTVPEPVEVPPGLRVNAPDERALGRLLNGGLRIRARCVNGCDIKTKLTLAPKTAKRFGYAERRTVIGRGSASLPVDRGVRMDTELNRRAKNRLAGAKRRFKVRLDVRATKDTAESARRTIAINP